MALRQADWRADSQAVYGYQLEKVTAKEKELIDDPKEKEVIAVFKARSDELAEKLKDVKGALENDRNAATKKLEELKAANASPEDIKKAEKALADVPANEEAAKKAGQPPRQPPMRAQDLSQVCRATPHSLRATPMGMRKPRKLSTLHG